MQGRILGHSRDRKAGANGEYKADLNTERDLSTRLAKPKLNVYLETFESREQAQNAIFDYIEVFYNL